MKTTIQISMKGSQKKPMRSNIKKFTIMNAKIGILLRLDKVAANSD
jgi:hypothetical protein